MGANKGLMMAKHQHAFSDRHGGGQQHSSIWGILSALRFEPDFSLPNPENLNWNALRLYNDNPV